MNILKLILHFHKHLDEYKVALFNLTALTFSFFETSKLVEKILQIVLLIASITFTVYKIIEAEKKRRKNKNDE